ncbi:GroES-like protein [Amylocystis lapponica]|nr:GroES-like protein [Amylocystis lapponica]
MTAQNPKTYTAYAFTRKDGPLERMTVAWKDPQPGEVVVKVLACGVCAGDEVVRGKILPFISYPRIPGHEIVGTVAAVPPTEKKWRVGERVGSGWHGGHCHACSRCRAGDFVTCAEVDMNGIKRDGGYAEYVTLHTEAVASVPEDIDPAEAAPLLCAGVTTYNSLRNMDITPPELVAVQGIGGLGHLGIQFARAMGYQTVALSTSSAKEAVSRELGAQEYVDGSKENQTAALLRLGGAKVIMCTTSNAAAIEALVPALTVNGTLLLLTNAQGLSIPAGTCLCRCGEMWWLIRPAALVVGRRLTVRGWPNGTPQDSEDTIRFVQVNGIKSLVERFPLEQAQKAFDARASAHFRAVITP